jgi:hypothetical protein
MEVTQEVLVYLDQRLAAQLAAQEARNEKLENTMNKFMEKTMDVLNSYPLNSFTTSNPAVSNRSQRATKRDTAETLPAEQETPLYDANFRHRHAARYEAEDETSMDSGTFQSYFRKRLSGLQSVAEDSIVENTVVRTVANIDPVKSGILLTYLDIKQLYKWSQDLIRLQRKHPHNKLRWALFITDAMTLRINAFNEAKRIIRRTIISGMEIDLPNEELFNLILEIVLPKSEQDWVDDFKSLVKFRKLHRNQHESAPDITRYDAWYEGIMELLYEANEVNELLSSNTSRNFAPVMKSYNGKMGLMQIFYELIPMGVGKNLHNQINYGLINHTDLTFRDYTIRLQEQNQIFQDASDVSKTLRAKMNIEDKTGTFAYNKTFMNNASHNKSNSNNYANKNHNVDNNNKQLVPYANPYHRKLNNLYDDQFTHNYKISYNDQQSYNEHDDSYNDDYDLDEVYGCKNEAIEGSNPGTNSTNTLSADETGTLNAIDRTDATLPCFAELQGKCMTVQCRFSHDTKLLQRTWSEKQQELNKSKYRPAMNQPLGSNTPLKPLRSITTEEGGQVSNTFDYISNDTHHQIDRNSGVQFADQGTRASPAPSKGGGDRGQQHL